MQLTRLQDKDRDGMDGMDVDLSVGHAKSDAADDVQSVSTGMSHRGRFPLIVEYTTRF
jgi:hypothetical protein